MIQTFDTPQALFEQAKQRILHQDDALKTLCVLMYYHLKTWGQTVKPYSLIPSESELVKRIKQPPVLLVGKTGSGKTHIIQELCKLVGVNFICVNCSHLSNSGYKGMNLSDIGQKLSQTAHDDHHLNHSVVFLDEFDKLFVGSQTGSNYVEFNRMLSVELLTLIEGTTGFPIKGDDKNEKHIPTLAMFFVLGGSFGMHHDSSNPPMGFTASTQDTQALPQTQQTLTDFGLPDELAGRIGKIITMNTMDAQMMHDILLNSPSSPYQSFCGQLALVHCTASFEHEVIEQLMINQKQAIETFGVRGVYQGFYGLPQITQILLDAPANPYHHYTITPNGFDKTDIPIPPEFYFDHSKDSDVRATEFFYDDDLEIPF